jgi:flagellar hook-associated protein 1 FlgK
MYSTFFGIELGKRALVTHQIALHTTSHNISNVNTPGYSRQHSELVTNIPWGRPEPNRVQLPGQLGTSVSVGFIGRARDMLLETQIRQETSVQGTLDRRLQYLQQVEYIFNDPAEDTIADSLNRFWNAWQELSAYPEDTAVRNTVLARGSQLVTALQNADKDLLQLQQQADMEITGQIDKINQMAGQIRDLNVEIGKARGVGLEPNDLMDSRDHLVQQLAEMVNVDAHELNNGLYSVTIGGHTIVQDNVFIPLQAVDDPTNNMFTKAIWSDDGSDALITSGQLKGLTEARDVYAPLYRQSLSDLALGVMNAVNPLQSGGYGLNGAAPTGENFFTGVDLASMAVNPILQANPLLVAAAQSANAPGDSSNALAIAQLKDAMLMAGGTQTFGQFYQSLVAQVGLDTDESKNSLGTQEMMVHSFQMHQASIAGVNLDEEMADLIKSQDAYQAASRVVTTVDEMLDVIINKMGLVGR